MKIVKCSCPTLSRLIAEGKTFEEAVKVIDSLRQNGKEIKVTTEILSK